MTTKHRTAHLRAAPARTTATAPTAATHTTSTPAVVAPEEVLRHAAQTIVQRGRMRDTSAGAAATPAERSMAATVAAFNALEGTTLTEQQGWRFMQVLKLARAAASARNGVFNADDYTDGAAYAALAHESAEHAAMAAQLSNTRIDPASLQ